MSPSETKLVQVSPHPSPQSSYPTLVGFIGISLNTYFGVFLQKRHALKNDEDWAEKCAEISHNHIMTPIQARKLKLLKHGI